MACRTIFARERRCVTLTARTVRAEKTTVKTLAIEDRCNQISSILVNDVTACPPKEPSVCLDGLSLSSRVKTVRLYK